MAAALRLTELLFPLMSRDLAKGTPADTMAHAIESNDASACSSGDHCMEFVQSLAASRGTDGATLSAWLTRAAQGVEPAEFRWEPWVASPVFDQILWDWGKRVGYDSIQLIMQPQAACGMWWMTELLDLNRCEPELQH